MRIAVAHMDQMDQQRAQCPGNVLNPASPHYRNMSKEQEHVRARDTAALPPVLQPPCLFVRGDHGAMCNPAVRVTRDSSGAGVAPDSSTP
jgi:hypothetical protein